MTYESIWNLAHDLLEEQGLELESDPFEHMSLEEIYDWLLKASG